MSLQSFRFKTPVGETLSHCIFSPQQLTNQDKTPAVISRAMAKHNLEVEPEEGYELVQVISEERGKTWLYFQNEPY